jgi:hypothetical protein
MLIKDLELLPHVDLHGSKHAADVLNEFWKKLCAIDSVSF